MGIFSVVDDDTLIERIREAQQRIVFVSPGVSTAVAKVLVSCMERLNSDAVTIILDVDAEVCRLGYGEHDAVKLLYNAMRNRGKELAYEKGIRIGLLIADDAMLVFAPTPLLIEAGPRNLDAPNAIDLDIAPHSVIQELGYGDGGVKDQTVGLDLVQEKEIKTVGDDLQQNPLQKFDVARTVRVFNAHLEFVEFELKGTAISRREVRIPSELMGLAGDEKTQKLLRANFRVVEEGSELSGEYLRHDKDHITRKFLKSLPGYGNMILRNEKADFEIFVRQLRCAVEAFSKLAEKTLQNMMDQNREKLKNILLPNLRKNPPQKWKMSSGSIDASYIEQCLDEVLCSAFGRADTLLGKMEVKLLFKGVTHESLKEDENFVKLAKAAFPSLQNILLKEYEAAPKA